MAIRDPLVAIRKKCLECSGGDKNEVASCEIVECPLHAFRMGVLERKNVIPPIPPSPRKKQAPGAAAEQEGQPQDKPKSKKNGTISATDQYTLF